MGDLNPNGVGDFEICTVDADGSDLRRLTDTPGEHTQPNWAPDGSSIILKSNRLGWPSLPSCTPPGFQGDVFGDEDVWIMRSDGTGQRNLTRNPNQDDSFPAWSPDGAWVMFTRYGVLFAVNSDGSQIAPVPNST